MRVTQQAVQKLVTNLYTAAVEPEQWRPALNQMRDLFGSAAAGVLITDNKTGAIESWIFTGTEAGQDEYLDHIKDVNPRVPYSATHRPGHIAWDYRFIEERAMDRHPFYDWLRRIEGYRYFVGTRAFDDGQHSGWTGVDWLRRSGHAQRAEIELFRHLIPHVASSLQLFLHCGSQRARASISGFLLDRAPYGVAFLNGHGRPVIMNRAAEAALARKDGLELIEGEFHASNPSDTRRLREFVLNAIRAGRGNGLGSGGALKLSRPSGKRPYAILVAPFPGAANGFSRLDVAAVVFITDPDLCEEGPEDALMRLYGLTVREAALAARLATEMNLDRAAGELGISRNTVRLHLQRVFDKTDTHTQAELLRLMLRLPRRAVGAA